MKTLSQPQSVVDRKSPCSLALHLGSVAQIAVIIPALNEEQAIARVITDLPNDLALCVIVVDNGSSDRTAEVAAESGALVLHQPERGYGAACLTGINALPPAIDIVVFLDADYSDYPEDIQSLIRPIVENKADFVVGTRTRFVDAASSLTPQQRWGNWLTTRLIKLFFRHEYSDLGPFRAIRRDELEALGMSDRNYGWTVEMQIKAITAGLRILEVAVRYRRRVGQSKVSGTISGTLRAGFKILYTVFRFALIPREAL